MTRGVGETRKRNINSCQAWVTHQSGSRERTAGVLGFWDTERKKDDDNNPLSPVASFPKGADDGTAEVVGEYLQPSRYEIRGEEFGTRFILLLGVVGGRWKTQKRSKVSQPSWDLFILHVFDLQHCHLSLDGDVNEMFFFVFPEYIHFSFNQ